jgi:hypothetical protein
VQSFCLTPFKKQVSDVKIYNAPWNLHCVLKTKICKFFYFEKRASLRTTNNAVVVVVNSEVGSRHICPYLPTQVGSEQGEFFEKSPKM